MERIVIMAGSRAIVAPGWLVVKTPVRAARGMGPDNRATVLGRLKGLVH
jgi:hypothetical protein